MLHTPVIKDEFRVVTDGTAHPIRRSLAAAQRDAERLNVASTQERARIQTRSTVDGKSTPWKFLYEKG
jgi:hypothetical protein